MLAFTMSTHIQAAPDAVFALFSDIEHAAERVNGIKKIEMLTPGRVGVGTRFRETRIVMNREATEEMYFTAFEAPTRYEVKCDSHGCEYTSVFRFRPDGSGTNVEVSFECRTVTFLAKLMSPLGRLMMGTMKKFVEEDVNDLKKLAESV